VVYEPIHRFYGLEPRCNVVSVDKEACILRMSWSPIVSVTTPHDNKLKNDYHQKAIDHLVNAFIQKS
jgi:hypothetical protein